MYKRKNVVQFVRRTKLEWVGHDGNHTKIATMVIFLYHLLSSRRNWKDSVKELLEEIEAEWESGYDSKSH